MKIFLSIVFFITISFFFLNAQVPEKNNWDNYRENYKLKLTMAVQMWNTYTFGQEIYDFSGQEYIQVNNRFNTQLRRTRMTFAGQPYDNLKFKITASLDLIGKDLLSATQGGANNGSSPIFRIWNAFVDWKVANKSDILLFKCKSQIFSFTN